MNTNICYFEQDGLILVGASNSDDEYLLWQRNEAESDIHFEWNDQSNGNYNCVTECSVDSDGVHILLKESSLVHFYFHNVSKDELGKLIEGLRDIYRSEPKILNC